MKHLNLDIFLNDYSKAAGLYLHLIFFCGFFLFRWEIFYFIFWKFDPKIPVLNRVKKLAPLTTRSSSLRCVLAAKHHTAELYSKNSLTKQRKQLPIEAIYLGISARNSRSNQAIEKLLWKLIEDASQKSSSNQMSLVNNMVITSLQLRQ